MGNSNEEVPQFRSTIPPELLKQLDPEEIYLFEGVSRLEQKTDWLISEVIETRRQSISNASMLTSLAQRVEKLEQTTSGLTSASGRIQTIEEWKSNFTGRWGVISAAFLLIVTAVLGALAKSAVDFIFK